MSEPEIGALLCVVTVIVLLAGVPISFGLSAVAIGFLAIFAGPDALSTLVRVFVEELSSFALLALPMFVLVGAVIGMSRAGEDLYDSLHRWLHRIPGGLVVANMLACGIFSAMCGSSPATAATIGKVGIPQMISRGVSAQLAAGSVAAGGTIGILIPPSITLIVYGIMTQSSVGRLFLAGVVPGIFLVILFSIYSWASALVSARYQYGAFVADASEEYYTFSEKMQGIVKTAPFLLIILATTFILYGGLATPSEVAGVAAFFSLVMVAVVYRVTRLNQVWPIMLSAMRDSTMILLIVASAAMYAYMMSYLYITQSVADWVVGMGLAQWQLLLFLNIFLLIAGCFLPPVSVILMSMPIIQPILAQSDIDLIWFAVVLTINLEIGMITPPVGLNLFVIRGVVPSLSLGKIMRGAMPFVGLMLLSIVFFTIFPSIVTWLPNVLMGSHL